MKLFLVSAAVCLFFAPMSSAQMIDRSAKPPAPVQEERAIALFDRGNACAASDPTCRIQNFTKALEIYPGFVEALNNRGSAFVDAGDKAAALRDFSKAIELE